MVKKKILIACLAGLLLLPNAAMAAPFPDKTDAVVQDQSNYINKEDRQKFADAIKQYPGQYKVVVVESTQPEAQTTDEYAHKLYDKYNLTDDAWVIVLNIDTEEVGVYTGTAVQAKGAKLEMLHEKIKSYYDPYRNQKEYMKGIELFIKEANAELTRTTTTPAANDTSSKPQTTPSEEKSLWASIPLWLYGLVVVFVAAIAGMMVMMIRRRSIFTEVDDVEDWKDELVEKIQTIEVEKSMRKTSGTTEERLATLSNRKENMLKVRIPDVEMIILEAEDACDRFRFQAARSLLSEGREILTEIENELKELKSDTTKVVQSKKESTQVIPEITKLIEAVERKLTNYRLDYGLSFHELKVKLDEVEMMRSQVKAALAAGDAVQAYEITAAAQQILEQVAASLDQIPTLIALVHKELKEEFKQLEHNISAAIGGGYDLNQTSLETGILQARHLLQAATSALEEGSISLVQTHAKAFEVHVDQMYQTMEDSVLSSQKQVAATNEVVLTEDEDTPVDAEVDEIPNISEEITDMQDDTDDVLPQDELLTASEPVMEMSVEERNVLLDKQPEDHVQPAIVLVPDGNVSESIESVTEKIRMHYAKGSHEGNPLPSEIEVVANEEADEEYELVIPKLIPDDVTGQAVEEENHECAIETEDDALDEMERISNCLVRVRQQIKRSYLPGVPDELKLLFDQVVQSLGRAQLIMESYGYSLDEVAYLIHEANESLQQTQRIASHTIATCQLAEGAIQYTNRYRRQNRHVNEALEKAESAFRQLRFSEALHIAEEARLIIEGEPEESVSPNRWLLRKKKKESQR